MELIMPLQVRGWMRVLGLVASAALVPATVASVAGGVFVATRDVHLLVRLIIVGLLFFAAAKVGGYAWMAVRLWRPREASIRLTDTELVVDHRGVFRRPLRVSRHVVGAATVVDDTREGLEQLGAFLMDGLRAAIPADLTSPRDLLTFAGARSALSALGDGVAVPFVGVLPDLPNVAIRLRAGVTMDTVWPGGGNVFPHSGFRTPRRGDKVRGLLLRVADPDRARASFAAWGAGHLA